MIRVHHTRKFSSSQSNDLHPTPVEALNPRPSRSISGFVSPGSVTPSSLSRIYFLDHFIVICIQSRLSSAHGAPVILTVTIERVWVYMDVLFKRGRGVKVGNVVDYLYPLCETVGGRRVTGMPEDPIVKYGCGAN